MKRKVYDIGPCRDGWRVKLSGQRLAVYAKKTSAIADARRRAHAEERAGRLAQIRVHGRNGRIQFEATYGRDPRKYRS